VILSDETLNVVEGGGNRTYTVTLNYPVKHAGDIVCIDLQPDIDVASRGVEIIPASMCLNYLGEQRDVVLRVARDYRDLITNDAFHIEHTNLDEPAILNVTIIDIDRAGVELSEIGGTLYQGDTPTNLEYTISLRTIPLADVTLTIIPDHPELVEISPNPIVFSTSGPLLETVTVSPVDISFVNNVTFRAIDLAHLFSSSDPYYSGIAVEVIPSPNIKIDWFGGPVPRVILSSSILEVIEGTSVATVYRVSLDVSPGAGLVVIDIDSSVDGSGASLDITPSVLNFDSSNWDEEQIVRVSYPRDFQYKGATIMDFNMTHRVDLLSTSTIFEPGRTTFWPNPTVQVQVFDIDLPEIIISEQSGFVTENGQTTFYKMRLQSIPLAPVSVQIMNPNVNLVSVSPETVLFTATNWNISQEVTISAVENLNDNAAGLLSVITILQHVASSSDPSYNGNSARFAPTDLFLVRRYENPTSPDCIPGTYQSGIECVQCDAGFQCPGGTADPIPCPLGSFSLAGQKNCTLCPAGFECPTSNSNSMTACMAGTYSGEGKAFCRICASGKMCPFTDAEVELDCPDGTFSIGAQQNCTSCSPGKACIDVHGNSIEDCELGFYAPGGSSVCLRCPAGFACTSTVRPPNDGERCQAGSFTSASGGRAFCTSCPAGYACPNSADSTQTPCAAGKFALAGNGTCYECPAGIECTSTEGPVGMCASGHYSRLGESSCFPCPAGHACLDSARGPVQCTAGEYAPTAQRTACDPCPAGYRCPMNRTISPEICPAGHYSYAGASECTSCSPGYWCQEGAVSPSPASDICPIGGFCNPPNTPFTNCPAGTFGTVEGGTSAEHACHPCPEGRFCHAGATPATHRPCPSGYYCPQNTTREDQFPCPPGKYNPSGESISETACFPVLPGSYAPLGSHTYYPCPSGFYCPGQTGFYLDFPCPIGTYSGSVTGLESENDCKPCEPGAYCPLASVEPVRCPEGTYNPAPSAPLQSNCLPCPAGWSCPLRGMVSYLNYTCVPGHYCPAGSNNVYAFPCPPGTFTDEFDAIRSEDCTTCPAGSACLSGTGGISGLQPVACAKGHYCPPGTQYATQYPCPQGTFTSAANLEREEDCTICPAGSFCVGGLEHIGSVSKPNGKCATGHYCPAGTHSTTQFPCPKGTYTGKTNLTHIDECTPCDKGHFCIEASPSPQPCAPGSFSDITGETDPLCQTCPAGYECALGTVDPFPCEPGYQSAQGHECEMCEGGHYCKTHSTTRNLMLAQRCVAGLLCHEGVDVEPQFANFSCPRAFYCPEAIPKAIECPVGTYNPHTGRGSLSDCRACDAGSYCVAASFEPTGTCDAGHFCPAGSTGPQQYPCPARTYRNRTGGGQIEDCAVCPAGYFCPAATVMPEPCPQGYYCVQGSDDPAPCPIGRFGNTTKLTRPEDCTPCPGGSYCGGRGQARPTGLCEAGFFCSTGAYTSTPGGSGSNWTHGIADAAEQSLLFDDIGGICPVGHYCPLGSSAPIPCEPGTFNNITGAANLAACVACLPGSFCSGYGNGFPTGLCSAGYYCSSGSESPTKEQVPPGTFAPEGSILPTPCEHGTFNGAWAQAHCTSCLPGFFCGNLSTVMPEICPPGSYCPERSVSPVRCPIGTFSESEQLGDVTQCTPCLPGHYCASNGLTKPSGLCEAGYYCLIGSPVRFPTNDSSYGGLCSAGHFCEEGSGFPEACPLGTYNANKKGQSTDDCKPCEAGYFCGERGLTAPSGPCDAGYYCNGTSSVASQASDLICPPGFFCPAGASYPTRCPQGSYAPDPGSGSCTTCPEGRYCDGIRTTESFECPMGSFCPSGTGASPPKCPPGTYSYLRELKSVEECFVCPRGSYCENFGLVNVSGTCAEGFVCDPGSKTQFGGGVDCYDASMLPEECPKGHYCQYGHIFACPSGTYNPFNGSQALEDCRPCDAGHWCFKVGIAFQEDFQCPVGHYCESPTSFPIPCQVGTFRDEPGGSEESDCAKCPPGRFCPSDEYLNPLENGDTVGEGSVFEFWNASSGSSFSLHCPAGTYCSGGNIFPVLCPAGFVAASPESGSLIRSSKDNACKPCAAGSHGGDPARLVCQTCSPGHVCLEAATTSTPLDEIVDRGYICPVGHYCPAGMMEEIPCPVGTFRNSTGASELWSDCMPCRENTYNSFVGQEGCRPCASSSFAEQGSTKCTCRGRNRAFEPSSGKCLCSPGYESFDQTSGFTARLPLDEDGDSDCQPRTYSRCGLGEILNANGFCVTEAEFCRRECEFLGDGSGGKLSLALGVCDCNGVLPLEQVCDARCRNNVTSGRLQPGRSLLEQTLLYENQTSGIRLADLEGYYGEIGCADGDRCKVLGCSFDGSGSSSCDYNLENTLEKASKGTSRRSLSSLEEPTVVLQPVLCIRSGDTILFNLGSEGERAYPVYKKDSLLNTNPDFDFGAFRFLQGAEFVEVFAFTFQDAGIYVFGSSLNFDLEMVVAVQGRGQSCPTEAEIVPKSASTLLALGAKRSNEIILEPDWSLMGALLGGMASFVAVLMLVLYCFREFALGTIRIVPRYRAHNKFLKDKPETTKAKTKIKSRSVAPMTSHQFKASPKALVGNDRWAEEDLDPREMVERIVSNHEEVNGQLGRQEAALNVIHDTLQREAQQLRSMLQEAAGGTLSLAGMATFRKQESSFTPWDDDSASQIPIQTLHEKESELLEKEWEANASKDLEGLNKNLDYEADETMLEVQLSHEEQLEDLEKMLMERKDLSEEEREQILQDFEKDQQMLRDTLDLEKKRQQEDLKNRLAERTLRNRRTTQRRQRSERKDEFKLAKQESMLNAIVEQLETKKAEAELEEFNIRLQREKVEKASEASESIKDASLAVLEEQDLAPIQGEIKSLRQQFEKERDEALAKQREELKGKLRKEIEEENARKEAELEAERERKRKEREELTGGLDTIGEEEDDGDEELQEMSVLKAALSEVAEEEVEAKVEIEAKLHRESLEKERNIKEELAKAIENVKKQAKDDLQAAEFVGSIRKDYEEKLQKLEDDTAAKRQAKYEALQARIAAKKRERIAQVAQEHKVDECEAQRALEVDLEEAKAKLEVELQARRKEDAERRLELDRREAELSQREAELVIRAASVKQGVDAEEEIKRLRETHEAAMAQLDSKQDEQRSKQREALKRKAEERKRQREELRRSKAEAMLKEEEETQDHVEEEATQVSSGPGAPSRKSLLWDHAVNRITKRLKQKVQESSTLQEEQERLSEEHRQAIEEMRKKQEEERIRLENEMELAREKLMQERAKEEDAERRRVEEQRRKDEEELTKSVKTAQELEAIKEQHEREFNAKLQQERETREKQREKLMKRLEEKKARKQQLLERRQKAELHKTETTLAKGNPALSREDEMNQERAAISALMKQAEDISPSKIYRAVEKVLDARHARERKDLAEKQFGMRARTIKDAFGNINAEKHQRKKELIQQGAAVGEIEKLEEESKEQLKNVEASISEEIATKHRMEEEELTKKHALEIGHFVSKYAKKPPAKEEFSRVQSMDLRELQQAIANERGQRIAAIHQEREDLEREARAKYEHSMALLEQSLRFQNANSRQRAQASFQQRQDRLLKQQREKQKAALEAINDPETKTTLESQFSRDRERLATALRSDRNRQVKKLEQRVEILKAKSARYYRRVLDSRLRDIADLTSRKMLIMEDSASRAVGSRKLAIHTASDAASTSAAVSSPLGMDFSLQREYQAEIPSPKTFAEAQQFRRNEAQRKIEELGHLDMSNSGTTVEYLQQRNGAPLLSQQLQSRLDQIESILRSLQPQYAESSETEYSDPMDRGLTLGDDLVVIDDCDLRAEQRERLELGNKIIDLLGLKAKVNLRVARCIPHHEGNTAFRNSFLWKDDEETLFLRSERFQNAGDFTLVLVHCLAHVKVHRKSENFRDNDPAFMNEFYAALRTINSDLVPGSAHNADNSPLEEGSIKFPERLAAYSNFSKSGLVPFALQSLLQELKLDSLEVPAKNLGAEEGGLRMKLKRHLAELENKLRTTESEIGEIDASVVAIQAKMEESSDDSKISLTEDWEALLTAKKRHRGKIEKLESEKKEKEAQLVMFLQQDLALQESISNKIIQG